MLRLSPTEIARDPYMVSTWSRGIYTVLQRTGSRGRPISWDFRAHVWVFSNLGPSFPSWLQARPAPSLPHSKVVGGSRHSGLGGRGSSSCLRPPTPTSFPSGVGTTNSSFHKKCACRFFLYVKWLRRQSLAARAMAVGGPGEGNGVSTGEFLPQLSAPSCVSMSTRQMGHFLLMASHWSTHS